MEYFSRQMAYINVQSQYAFHLGCKGLRLTHLMFADDVLVFSRAHPPTLQNIMLQLADFQACSGLTTNPNKSQAIYGGCSGELLDACQQITGFGQGQLSLRYLSVPLISSHLTKVECRSLVEKITSKLMVHPFYLLCWTCSIDQYSFIRHS